MRMSGVQNAMLSPLNLMTRLLELSATPQRIPTALFGPTIQSPQMFLAPYLQRIAALNVDIPSSEIAMSKEERWKRYLQMLSSYQGTTNG